MPIFKTDILGGMVIGATISNFGTSMQMSGRTHGTLSELMKQKKDQANQFQQISN